MAMRVKSCESADPARISEGGRLLADRCRFGDYRRTRRGSPETGGLLADPRRLGGLSVDPARISRAGRTLGGSSAGSRIRPTRQESPGQLRIPGCDRESTAFFKSRLLVGISGSELGSSVSFRPGVPGGNLRPGSRIVEFRRGATAFFKSRLFVGISGSELDSSAPFAARRESLDLVGCRRFPAGSDDGSGGSVRPGGERRRSSRVGCS